MFDSQVDTCNHKYAEYKVDKNLWHDFITEPVAILTGLLVGATIMLWWSTKKLVISAERTAVKQLRAYVFLDPEKEMTFVSKPSTSSTFEVEIHAKNTGITPAHDVVGESWVALGIWPLPSTFNFFGPKSDEPASRSVIPPGGKVSFHTGSSRPFTDKELEAIQSGALRVYIYGRISYKDSFGNPYYTNFCHASTALGKLGFTTAVAKCDRHNDTN